MDSLNIVAQPTKEQMIAWASGMPVECRIVTTTTYDGIKRYHVVSRREDGSEYINAQDLDKEQANAMIKRLQR